VLREEGLIDEGLAQCERALSVSRTIGNRRLEGGVLATRGELLASQARFAEAREALAAGEGLLRDAGDQMGLVKLLSTRAFTELAAGDKGAALAAATAAEHLLAQTSAGAYCDAARRIAALRGKLKATDGNV
jgi:hypothetical protein